MLVAHCWRGSCRQRKKQEIEKKTSLWWPNMLSSLPFPTQSTESQSKTKKLHLAKVKLRCTRRFRCYNVHIPLKLLIHWFSRIYRPILTRTGNLCAQASYRRRNKPAKNVTLSPVQPQCFCQHRGWSHVFPPVSSSPFSLWLSLCLCIFCRVV